MDKELSEAPNPKASATWDVGAAAEGGHSSLVPPLDNMELFRTQESGRKHMKTSGPLIMTKGSSASPKPWGLYSSGENDEK